MSSSASVGLLVVLCLGLLAALSMVLMRLYRLEAEVPAAEPMGPREGWEKLDEFLAVLAGIQETGSSLRPGPSAREDFCRTILDSGLRLMGSGRGSVMLYDEKDMTLRIAADKGLEDRDLVLKADEGVAGRVFSNAAPLIVSDPRHDPQVKPGKGEIAEPFLSLPLLIHGKPLGVLTVHATPGTRPFNEYNIKFLEILAKEAAALLKNLDLYDDLESFYLELVQTLARVVDSKDAYTHDHSDRARERARRLAREMKVPDPMARYIEYAALLHDIGKIGIDESILLKPGKLTSEEYEVMKKHPVIGHQILAPVKYLGPVAQMVLHHQEWYNGQGYPDGLRAEEIPLGARIVAVIDAWDAMTSDRPYRKALPRETAVSELKRGAGTQFDPRVVEAFLALEGRQAPPPAGRGRVH